MNKRKLGNIGLETTLLGFGSMELGRLTYKEAEKVLHEALDGGIQLIDSSPCYGKTEEYIGKAVGHRREEYILATKCGCHVGEQGEFLSSEDHIWTAEQMYQNIDRSLQLLQTDYIDIWQLHGLMPEFLPGGREDEVLEAAERIKESGKVRHIAFSCRNGSPDQELYPALFGYHACKAMFPWKKFEVVQLIYGALTRTNEEIIDYAAKEGMGVICRGALKRYFPDYDRLFEQAGLDELREEGETREGFLLRFAISHKGIGTVLVGTQNVQHLKANISACEKGPLSETVLAEAKRRLDSVGVAPYREKKG